MFGANQKLSRVVQSRFFIRADFHGRCLSKDTDLTLKHVITSLTMCVIGSTQVRAKIADME